MSEHATATAAGAAAHGQAGAASTPEFDHAEVTGFGKDDSHAIVAISRMLVMFFFYSFLIMAAVGLWTWSKFGGAPQHPAAHHEVDEE